MKTREARGKVAFLERTLPYHYRKVVCTNVCMCSNNATDSRDHSLILRSKGPMEWRSRNRFNLKTNKSKRGDKTSVSNVRHEQEIRGSVVGATEWMQDNPRREERRFERMVSSPGWICRSLGLGCKHYQALQPNWVTSLISANRFVGKLGQICGHWWQKVLLVLAGIFSGQFNDSGTCNSHRCVVRREVCTRPIFQLCKKIPVNALCWNCRLWNLVARPAQRLMMMIVGFGRKLLVPFLPMLLLLSLLLFRGRTEFRIFLSWSSRQKWKWSNQWRAILDSTRTCGVDGDSDSNNHNRRD